MGVRLKYGLVSSRLFFLVVKWRRKGQEGGIGSLEGLQHELQRYFFIFCFYFLYLVELLMLVLFDFSPVRVS